MGGPSSSSGARWTLRVGPVLAQPAEGPPVEAVWARWPGQTLPVLSLRTSSTRSGLIEVSLLPDTQDGHHHRCCGYHMDRCRHGEDPVPHVVVAEGEVGSRNRPQASGAFATGNTHKEGSWASPPTWSTPSGNAFANPMATDAPIDRGVHRTIIPEFDVPNHHPDAAQQRGQE